MFFFVLSNMHDILHDSAQVDGAAEPAAATDTTNLAGAADEAKDEPAAPAATSRKRRRGAQAKRGGPPRKVRRRGASKKKAAKAHGMIGFLQCTQTRGCSTNSCHRVLPCIRCQAHPGSSPQGPGEAVPVAASESEEAHDIIILIRVHRV